MHTTNLVVAGKTVVVAGYGWCGKGVAMRAAGMGANVIVTEVDPFKALDATMNGFRVMTMDQAAPLGDVFVTVTGCKDVIVGRHFQTMKHNALLANAGHFDCEVNVAALRELAESSQLRRENIVGYTLPNGKTLNVLAEGRLVNLAAGNGHPAEIMDMIFRRPGPGGRVADETDRAGKEGLRRARCHRRRDRPGQARRPGAVDRQPDRGAGEVSHELVRVNLLVTALHYIIIHLSKEEPFP